LAAEDGPGEDFGEEEAERVKTICIVCIVTGSNIVSGEDGICGVCAVILFSPLSWCC
jgi:hypothetical protein